MLETCGNVQESLTIRNMIGFGKSAEKEFHNVNTGEDILRSYSAAIIAHSDITNYEPALALCKLIQDMTKLSMYTNIAELGYVENASSISYTYIAFYLPIDLVEEFRKYAGGDEEMKVYICDAEKELEMWNLEKDDPIGKYGGENRKPAIVTRDDARQYSNVMFVRYPLDEFAGRNGFDEQIVHITKNYVWVQVRPRVFGEKTFHVCAFMRGFLENYKLTNLLEQTSEK